MYPDWGEYDVYQPLVVANLSAEFPGGVIQFLPALAQNWTVSANGTIYTFNLRQNVTFSDGNAFNAYQVWTQMYGFYYLTANSSGWYDGYTLFNMTNVDFGPGTIAILNSSGLIKPSPQAVAIMSNASWPIYAPNPYTIVFHLINQFQWFLGTLVTLTGLLYDSQWLLDHGGFGTATSINNYFNQNPIPGTGPYMVTQVSEEAYVSYTQNPNYWGRDLPPSVIASNEALDPGHVKNVIIYAREDDISRYTDLSSGAVQIAEIGGESWDLITANPNKYSYFTLPSDAGITMGLSMNMQLYPTNITDVRLAIVHAINYTAIDNLFYGQVSPWIGPEYGAWSQFYNLGNFSGYQYNVTLAKQELAAAGFPNGNGLPALSYVTSGEVCDFCIPRAEIVEADLGAIGINVNIDSLSFDNWCDIACNSYSWYANNTAMVGNLEDLGDNDWSPSFLTPVDFWVDFVSNQSPYGNTALINNTVTQACVNSFLNGSSTAQVQTLCTAAQAWINQNAPYAWFASCKLFYCDSSIAWQKSVIKSVYFDPLWDGDNREPLFNTVTFV